MLGSLLGILIRFIEKKIALKADTESIVTQVSVLPEDRKFLRFLWKTDFGESTKILEACAIMALMQTAIDNAEQFPELLKIISEHFYLDDLVHFLKNEELAKQICERLRDALHFKFNLTKFCSNSAEVCRTIPMSHLVAPVEQIQRDGFSVKTLGVLWVPSRDEVGFKKPKLEQVSIKNMTQRRLLSIASKTL